MTTHVALRIVDGDEELALLEWRQASGAVLRFVEPSVKPSLEQWVAHGLNEWVGPGLDPTPRTTPSSAREFLPRLRDHLARQYSFTMELTESPIVEATATIIQPMLHKARPSPHPMVRPQPLGPAYVEIRTC